VENRDEKNIDDVFSLGANFCKIFRPWIAKKYTANGD